MARPGHISPVRLAVHETVSIDRWKDIARAMVTIAESMEDQSVQAAKFLADHAPAPDELAEQDQGFRGTLVAGPQQVDELVARLAASVGCAPLDLPQVVELLMEAREARKKAETSDDGTV